MTQIQGKLVVLTGAGSGIGRALAEELSARGARLALADIDAASLRQTVEGLRGPFTEHVVDVGDRTQVENFAREVQAAHGGVDILINNAGIATRARFDELSYEQLERVLAVNLWGVIHGTKAFLPQLRARDEAHLVNIGSVNAFVPFPENAAYSMSKYAVRALSETLQQELAGASLRVTCVHPGAVKTNIVRSGAGFTNEQAAYFDSVANIAPADAAKAIVRAIERNRAQVLIGRDAWLMALGRWIAPFRFVSFLGALLYGTARPRIPARSAR